MLTKYQLGELRIDLIEHGFAYINVEDVEQVKQVFGNQVTIEQRDLIVRVELKNPNEANR